MPVLPAVSFNFVSDDLAGFPWESESVVMVVVLPNRFLIKPIEAEMIEFSYKKILCCRFQQCFVLKEEWDPLFVNIYRSFPLRHMWAIFEVEITRCWMQLHFFFIYRSLINVGTENVRNAHLVFIKI